MKTMKFQVSLVSLLLLTVALNGFAVPIADVSYDLTDLGGGSFIYDYEISNTVGGTEGVIGMTIGFDPDPFTAFQIILLGSVFDTSGMSYDAEPAGWSSLAADPFIFGAGFGIGTAMPGFASAFGPGVAPGSDLSGFSVSFNYAGAPGNLGAQQVELTFADGSKTPDLYSGSAQLTTPSSSGVIPEPSTIILLTVGLGGLLYHRVSKRKKY